MENYQIGLFGLAIGLALLIIRTPIAVVLGLVSFGGIWSLTSFNAAWSLLGAIPIEFATNWNLSAVPMFLFMGFIASRTGLTVSFFEAGKILLGRIPGGLASSTVVASAMFASASGSSVATAAAFSKIAVPQMLKQRYDPGLACGTVAASGTLGSLIPPSVLMILFGIFTQTSIEALFIAGIIPGILSAVIYIGMITIRTLINPSLAPVQREPINWDSARELLHDAWPLPVLIFGVMGGIFLGLFTPTEAGAIGAVLALTISIFRGSLNIQSIQDAAKDTLYGTSTIFIIAIGAAMLTRFLTLSQLPLVMSELIAPIGSNPIILILLIGVIFIILGMFVESISLMLLTIPLVLPMLDSMDVNLIWFGIIMIKLLEVGLITPPVGLNVFVMKGALGSQVPIGVMFKGTFWFLAMDLLTLAIIVAFPALTLFLPSLMN